MLPSIGAHSFCWTSFNAVYSFTGDYVNRFLLSLFYPAEQEIFFFFLYYILKVSAL